VRIGLREENHMKRTFFALGMALIAASSVGSESSLKALDARWKKALLAGDAAALTNLYAPDAVMYPPDAVEARGHDAIRKVFEALLAGKKVVDFQLRVEKIEAHGTTAVGWGLWTLKMAPQAGGGDPIVMEGRYMEVAKRIGGKWLFVADHASVPLPLTATSK
jgi:uncharacterized protein (TIGR02246 family)